MSAEGLTIEITENTVSDEAEAQTGERPVRCILSRQTTEDDFETTWLISFAKKVQPFRLFGHSWSSKRAKHTPKVQQCNGCFRFHGSSVRCERKTCPQCACPQHEGTCKETTPKCINCNGPHHADDTKCPARPKAVAGTIRKPSWEQIRELRVAGGRDRSRALNEARKQSDMAAKEAMEINSQPEDDSAMQVDMAQNKNIQAEASTPSRPKQADTIVCQ